MPDPQELDTVGSLAETSSGAGASSSWGDDPSRSGGLDLEFAGLVESITRRLQQGEPVDDAELLEAHPAWAATLRSLLPALRELAELGKVVELDDPGSARGPDSWAFGDFRILRELGRGGMGVVYEAEQVSLGRRVAIKLLPRVASMDPRSVRRFQLEAQVAGWLQHPRIVPVHEVGLVDGVPFYAMRYIEGGSLAEVIATLRGLDDSESGATASEGLGSLAVGLLSGRFSPSRGESEGGRSASGSGSVEGSPPSGLAPSIRGRAYVRTAARLALQVAEALEYAHEQGVVHRDIKPANLLLDRKGEVWVADFGMADVQGDAGLTQSGDLPGTLRYMSPEQASGKRALVDRRSDVYSLGATLYELLTLRAAVSGLDREAIFRQIAEGEPAPPGRLNPAISVDLATILAKAMAREPAGRYETAGHLADDLGRFLEGRPIAARPVGPLARGWRWCRRKPLLAGMTASLAATLLVGMVGITWSWRESVRQRSFLLAAEKEARRQAGISEAINAFLIDRLLGQASPENNPDANRVTLLEVLDRAASEVGTSFAGRPEIEASIRLAVGRAYHGLGENAKGEAQFREALAILGREGGERGRQGIEASSNLGHALDHLGRTDEAEPLLRQAVEASRAALEPGDKAALSSLVNLADLEANRGHLAQAEALYRRMLEDARKAPKPDQDAIFSGLNNLGVVLVREGKLDEAEALDRRLVDDSTALRGPKHPGTLSSVNNLATLLEKRGRYEEAERLFRKVAELNREVLGPGHPGHFAAQFNLAHVLADLGRIDEAEALFRENLERQRASLDLEHPTTLYTTSRLAALLQARGKLEEAERLLRPCLDAQKRRLGPDHPDTLKTARRLDAVLEARARAASPAVGGR